ncbi:helix-turn-helix domain-containing protein [Aquimarina algiphila]|uniref:Helix-turn-helix domain-containing protein n=2 Tax=Flavobacteriaceae TaxID=49546 RepID=A0A554VIG1_9FLAO|nr:helix-turn-helix domain-containing protein [Aquimarina algiphila]
MEVICLESQALYMLVDKVVEQIKEKHNVKEDKWISPTQAMRILNISSDTTLQKLRDTMEIEFSQPSRKIILYDRDSIYAYLERHRKKAL